MRGIGLGRQAGHYLAEIQIIGVPMDLGADRRGVDMGPSAIRYAGLSEKLRAIGHKVEDMDNIDAPIVEASKIEYANAKYLSEVKQVCLSLSKVVYAGLIAKKIPIVLGGDHSIAMGTFAGIHAATGKSTGVIWLDAHGDFNTPDITPSGNIHGMSLALSSGQGSKWFPTPPWPKQSVDPKRTVIVGARQLDPDERSNLKKAGIRVFSMSDIDRKGMKSIMNEAIKIASGSKHEPIHVSFDLDVVDPSDAPGVGTPVRGGVTYREAHLAMEMLYEAGVIRSLEMVEVNPILDEQNRTAELAVELILSAMGKKII
ncbi:MAG: arginase [Nitrososphaerota archaeon]|nr:arginase [Nitrososphaerota archaeon]